MTPVTVDFSPRIRSHYAGDFDTPPYPMPTGIKPRTRRRSIPVVAPVLSLSKDRKTAPFAVWETAAARWKPMGNAFGTTQGPPSHGGTCTGTTAFCEGCYVGNNPYPSTHELLARNAAALRAMGDDVDMMAAALSEVIVMWRDEHRRAEKRSGRVLSRTFRIHWSGDYYSLAYAKAWRRVVDANPDVTFWTYTRSITPENNVLPVLVGSLNHNIYVSVDTGNVAAARRALKRFPTVLPAFCGDTWAGADALAALFPDRSKGARCPENTGKIPLVSADGVGACEACGLCIYGRNSVRFAIDKREAN